MPFGDIMSINPASVIGRGQLPQPSGPTFAQSRQREFDRLEARDAAQRNEAQALEQKQYDRGMDRDRIQRDALYKMLDNPHAAQMIAKQAGINYTPELNELVKQPKLLKLTADGASLAKEMGVKDYEAARQFTQAYVQSNGNAMAAMSAIEGYVPSNDSPPETRGLPQGQMWQDGRAVDIPGADLSRYRRAGGSKPMSVNDISKIQDPSGVLARRLIMDNPDLSVKDDNGNQIIENLDPAALGKIQSTVLQYMAQNGGDYESAYQQAMQDLTGGAGLEAYDANDWLPWKDMQYRLPNLDTKINAGPQQNNAGEAEQGNKSYKNLWR